MTHKYIKELKRGTLELDPPALMECFQAVKSSSGAAFGASRGAPGVRGAETLEEDLGAGELKVEVVGGGGFSRSAVMRWTSFEVPFLGGGRGGAGTGAGWMSTWGQDVRPVSLWETGPWPSFVQLHPSCSVPQSTSHICF